MTTPQTELEQLAAEEERGRAHFAMLACRDMANHAVHHALDLAQTDPTLAIYFDGLARQLREKERAAAVAAGIDPE